MSGQLEDGVFIGFHTQCIANEFPKRPDGKQRRPCGSSDGLAIYEKTKPDGETYYDAVCYSCRQFFHPEEVHKSSIADQIGADPESGVIKEKKKFENKASKKAKITREEVQELWSRTGGKEGNSAKGYRGLSDESLKFYGFRVEYDNNGEVKAVYFPETQDYKLVGYKSRHDPKGFGYNNLGKTGGSNQLSGQCRFPDGGRYCVPMDTQILTRTGWKYYHEISVGEIVLGYDQKTHTQQWTKVTEKHHFQEDDVYEFGAGINKLRSTSNHRWFVNQRREKNGERYLDPQVRLLKDFDTESRLIVNAPFVENLYSSPKNELELSTSKYGDIVGKILDMSHTERVAWLDGFLLADGSLTGKSKDTWEGAQNRGDIFEAVLLCSYLVHDKIVRVKNEPANHLGNVCSKVVLSSTENRSRLKETTKWVSKEPVWCVTTELGSWVMRQGDTINITGNCLLVGGEFDMIAAQDMLREYQRQKGQLDYDRYAVVSPTAGEPSAVKQCRKEYEWFDKFDVIVLGLDNDDVGIEVMEELANVLPKDKVRIAKWSGKDPNKMLQDGKKKQFLSDFFGARELVDTGVYNAANGMLEDVIDVLTTPRISLPPFAKKLQEMSKGSLYTKSIYSLIGDTSVGKSTFIDAWIFYWMFELKHHKVGIVSIEATKGEWVAGMLSTYLAHNLWWIPQDEIRNYMETPEVKDKINHFFYNEFGESRFAIVDDREGTVQSLQKCIERLERQYGCTIIVNDVLTDILRVEDMEAQARHFNWQSNFVKGGATIFNILHTRKPSGNRGGRPTFPDEFDAYGNSIFVQKAAGNFVIARNKEAPNGDWIEQNTTYLRVPKLRKGITGDGGAWFYDGETRQVYDREEYFKNNPDKLPAGYDLSVSSFDRAYWEEGGRGWDGVSDKKYQPKQKIKQTDETDFMDGVNL